MDADHNNAITRAEVEAFYAGRAQQSGEAANPRRVDRMLRRMDGNSDGQITLEEMRTAEGAQFDQRDANRNGTIDAGEAGSGGQRQGQGQGQGQNAGGDDE